MNKWLSSAVTMGVLFGLVPALPAQEPRQPQPSPAPAPEAARQAAPRMNARAPALGGAFNPSRILERREVLLLTADQVTRLSTLEKELTTAREKAATDARPHREELQKLLQQSAPDVAQVRTHAQALMQAEQAGRLAAITTSVQSKAVLTPEQRGRVQGWADGGRSFGFRRQMPRQGRGPQGLRPGRMPVRRGAGGV